MKKLNTEIIEERFEKFGFSASDLAKKLNLSRTSISNWLNHKKFPRPSKLLKLARILDLSFDELVIQEENKFEPVIAFRKKGNHKITEEYIEDAKDKGYLLEKLVEYLPYDTLSVPPVLKEPKVEYNYIKKVAETFRKDIGKGENEEIECEDLIDFFNENYAVIIPVFSGHKKNHENALHVFLPSSMTTWIYLNLDSNINDFKFWMAHELGHSKAPTLRDDEAEDFADKFAGALLVSYELAKEEYLSVCRLANKSRQISRILDIAQELLVSPLTVYYELNRYAEHTKKPLLDHLEENHEIYKVNTSFCSKHHTVAEILFNNKLPPKPKKYIKTCKKEFETPFFDTLQEFLLAEKKSPTFIQSVLSVSPADAQALYDELC